MLCASAHFRTEAYLPAGYPCYKNIDPLSLNSQSQDVPPTLTLDPFSFTRRFSCLTRSSRVVSVATDLIL